MTEAHCPSIAMVDRTIGEIAATLPGSTAVFRAYKLDFCCGGNIALSEAALRKGLSPEAIAAQLQALDPGADAQLPHDVAGLIAHIFNRYHQVHRRELPELIRLARRVEAVHKAHPKVPAGLADALTDMQQELELHMQKEEQVLFPMMSNGPGAFIAQPIDRMRAEHDDHGRRLRLLEELTDGGTTPEGACPTWRALYVGVGKLADDLMEHIHLENNVLFPRFSP